MVQIKKANPDCPLCRGTGMIVKDEFQKDAPACHLCFPNQGNEQKVRSSTPSPSPDREVGGDAFLEWLDKEIEHEFASKDSWLTDYSSIHAKGVHWAYKKVKEKYLSLQQSPSLPADKPVTLPYVKATDRLPEDGQQIFFRLKRPNQPAKYLAGFFKKDNRPDKTNGGDLSGFTDDRNLYALSININYIDWVDEYSLADKFPSLPVEPEKAQPDPYVEWLDKEIEICRTNWEHHTGMSQPQYWAGRFGSMEIVKEKYLSFRQPQALPIEEGVDLKRIESDAISNLPEYLKDGRDKGRFAWEEGYRAGATNELYSLRTQLQSLISDNDSLRKEAQQLQQDNADDAHRANITIQSLTEERDALKQAYELQRVELKKI